MQSENDDIEGLFRRASDDYPLNTGSANWDHVASMLDNEKPSVPPFFNWKKLIGPAILAIFFFGAATIGINYFYGSKDKIAIAGNEIKQTDKSTINFSDNTVKPLTAQSPLPAGTQKETDNMEENKLYHKSLKATHNKVIQYPAPALFKNTTRLKAVKSNLLSTVSSPATTKTLDNNNTPSSITKPDIGQSLKITSPIEESKTNTDLLDSINQVSQKNEEKNVPLKKNQVKKKVKSSHPYLYVTALVGPDVSNVKQQSYDNAGLSVGALVGLSKNKWTVETGIVWDKKYYYSNAKYFKPKTTSTYKTIDLSGNCNMYEIPVNIGFKLINSKHGNVIIKSGLSSYLMKKEFYNYNYYNNYYQRVSGSATYNNSSNNWFSVLNFSLNYNYKLSKSASIGVEPYFKVPLQGLGYGRLPISSSGLYVVISKKLF